MSRREPGPLDRTPADAPGCSTTMARFDTPRGPGTTFAVVADVHLRGPHPDHETGNRRARRRLAAAVADADRLDVDAILVAGDLTAAGRPVEVEIGEQVLGDPPAPVLAVPGDRDLAEGPGGAAAPAAQPDDGTGESAGRAADSDDAVWASPGACPYARRVGGVTVLGVDTASGGGAVPTATRGGAITRAERSWLVRTARADPDPTMLLAHHAIAPLPGAFDRRLDDRRYRVREPARTADVLDDAGVDLAVSGHLQWPTATRYRGVDAVGAPSIAGFPPAYLLVDVEPRGTTVSLVPLADERGLEADYRRARTGDGRGAAVRDAVGDGYFDGLPFVDSRSEPLASPTDTTAPRGRFPSPGTRP